MHIRRSVTAACITGVVVATLLPAAPTGAEPSSIATAARPPAGAADPRSEATDDGSLYVPVTPCRIADTRRASAGPLGASRPQRTFSATSTASIRSQGGNAAGCGIPAAASAVATAITAVGPKAAGYLRAWPTGTAIPTATALNFRAGVSITNSAIVPLAGGALELRATTSTPTDVVVDATGYYLPLGATPRPAAASVFVPIRPCRIADTRRAVDGPFRPSAPHRYLATAENFFVVRQGGDLDCGISSSATSFVASITAVAPGASGYLRAWAAGAPEPTATVLNFADAGTSITNTVTLPRAAGSGISVRVQTARPTDVVVDISGYFVPAAEAPPTSAVYHPVTPCRLADTRLAAAGPLRRATPQRTFKVAGTGLSTQGGNGAGCAIPTAASAVAASLSAVAPSAAGYARAWAAGRPIPQATMINFGRPRVSITNSAFVELGSGGAAVRAVSAGTTDVVLDVAGYFAPLPPPPPLREVVSAGSGGAHTCASLADGAVRCWGRSADGRLGDGGPVVTEPFAEAHRSVPSPVVVIDDALQVAAGTDHTCAVLAGGTVQCWGQNSAGQLGNGTTTTRSVPSTVVGLTDAVEVTAGDQHTCARRVGGTVVCWGSAWADLNNPVTSPTVVAGLADVATVDAGTFRSCAVLGDGSVRCWGRGDESTAITDPAIEVEGLTDVEDVAVGYLHACAAGSVGTVRCWGANEAGALGNGTSSFDWELVPVGVVGLTGVTALDAGNNSTCARRTDGSVWCWGLNSNGQLGRGTVSDPDDPDAPDVRNYLAAPVVGLAGATDIAVGRSHACATTADTTLRCWGTAPLGRLGDGRDHQGVGVPVPVTVVAEPR